MALTEAAASLIGAGIAAGTSAATSIGIQTTANRRAYKWSKKMAVFQDRLNLMNWLLQNQYNLPANQMQRLKDAGINPYNLAQSGAQGNTAGSLPGASSGGFTPYQMDAAGFDIAGKFQSSATWLESLKNLVQDRKNKKAEERLHDAQTENVNADTNKKNIEAATGQYLLTHNLPLSTKKLGQEIENLAARNLLLSLQSENTRMQTSLAKFQLDEILPLKQLQMDIANKQAWYNLKYMSPAQRLNYLAHANQANAEADFTRGAKTAQAQASAANLSALTDNVILQGANIVKQGRILDIQKGVEAEKASYFHTTGTDKPGEIKILGVPIGAAIHILGRSRRFNSYNY